MNNVRHPRRRAFCEALGSVADLLQIALIVVDAKGEAVFADASWVALSGQYDGEWRGAGWQRMLDPIFRDSDIGGLLTATQSGSVHEVDWSVSGTARGDRVLHVTAVPGPAAAFPGSSIVTITDVTEQRNYLSDLLYQATHDDLTGCYNRAQFLEFLRNAQARRIRAPRGPAAVLFVDVDGLKQINDRFGHRRGDDVLRRTAEMISANARSGDIVARYGGDEFTVLCEDLRSEDEVSAIVERIRHAKAAAHSGQEFTLSIGAALVDDPTADPVDIVDAADREMYRSRQSSPAHKPALQLGGLPRLDR